MRAWVFLVTAGYAVFVGAGITTSSIGIAPLLDRPTHGPPGLIAGSPDPIRSDEFLRGTPWAIGTMTAGGDSFGSPLSFHDPDIVAAKTDGAITKVLFAETSLQTMVGRLLPEQAFSAAWWLPVWLLVVSLPLWFRRLGVGIAVSIPVSLVVVLSPASVWWTWNPVVIMGWAVVAALTAMSGAERVRARRWDWRAAGLLTLSAAALARLALSYQLWAIPIGVAVLIPTTVALLAPADRRRRIILPTAATAVLGVLILGAFLLEHRESLDVLAQTTYPGTRRFAGTMTNPATLFGAPHLWVLQTSAVPINTNQSEITSGYLVLGVAALALVPVIAWGRSLTLRPPAIASGLALAALASWCMLDWPDRAKAFFPMSLVAPGRLAQILGLCATLTFGLFFAAWARSPVRRRGPAAVTTGLLAFFVTTIGGSFFRQTHLPSYRAVWVALVAVLTAGAIAFAVQFANKKWALVPIVVLASAVTATVNPIQSGFADLHDGYAARVIQAQADRLHDGALWVSDDAYTDALLMANAVPSLSGEQWVGPEESAWSALDPSHADRDVWNRGAAIIHFDWAAPGTVPAISLLSGVDLIQVLIDPCDEALSRLGVKMILSRVPLEGSCLRPRGELEFGGSLRYLYLRRGDT